jgi:methionyl-tRNA formyltransferase
MELGVPITDDTSLQRVEQLITQLRPCCVVVSSYDRIIPSRMLSGARFINVHYAPLPRYRGRASVNWAILNGETSTAISIHTLVPDLDGGNILFQRTIAIEANDTVWTVYERLNVILREHLADVVADHLAGAEGLPQNHANATYGCTRVPRDGEINWAQPTQKIYDLIRALHAPYPGAFTYLKTDLLRVWDAAPVKNPLHYEGRVPGRVVQVARRAGWVDVLTGDGVLRIAEVEPAGGPRQPAAEVITSVKWTLGLQMFDLLQRVEMLETALSELCQQYGRPHPVDVD